MNVTLIGMPASGKSTVGVLLAKRLGYDFVDVDIVIQNRERKTLKQIIEAVGDDGFRKIEDDVNASLNVERSVIAPGGSVIYGERAMKHLKEISKIVYLKMSYEETAKRLGDLRARGITFKDGQTLRDLYDERVPLYEKYADMTVDERGRNLGDVMEIIKKMLEV